ncbi:MAG: glycosyltransferase family 2 protein [Nitrospiraceae bacterium]|nr:glycosyltransferase family 2 protein [Nitrospiraceae bacterium]
MSCKTFILILNWNNWKDTVHCLESVFRNTGADSQVIVLDNGSKDGSVDRITQWAAGGLKVSEADSVADNKPIPHIVYDRETAEKGGMPEKEKGLYGQLKSVSHPLIIIRTGWNLGYAGGNNVGIRYALKKSGFDYIWILNNDTEIKKDTLPEMIACAESDEKTGMVGSKLLYHHNPAFIQMAGGGRINPYAGNVAIIAGNARDDGKWDHPFELDYACGASLLVRKKAIESVGLMDEKYFLYWEDVDWGVRARRKGFKLAYCPKSVLLHKEGGTSGSLSPKTDYYWVRNGLYFTRKFYPYFLPLIPFSYLVKHTVIRKLKRQPLNFKSYLRGLKDFLLGKTGP